MTNWQDISEELQKEWENLNFTWEDIQDWIEVGGLNAEDASFAFYLSLCGYAPKEMDEENTDSLRKSYEKNPSINEKKSVSEGWKSVHHDFTPKLIIKWKKLGFSNEEIKEWIGIGFHPAESKFCAWLWSLEQKPKDILNFCNYEELKEQYQELLLTKAE